MEGPACALPHGHSPPSFISWFSKLSKLACRASEESIFGFSHPATGLYLLSQQQSRSRANCWPAHRIYTCKDDQSLSPRRATEAEQASQGNVTRRPHSALAWAPWQQSMATEHPIPSRWHSRLPGHVAPALADWLPPWAGSLCPAGTESHW